MMNQVKRDIMHIIEQVTHHGMQCDKNIIMEKHAITGAKNAEKKPQPIAEIKRREESASRR